MALGGRHYVQTIPFPPFFDAKPHPTSSTFLPHPTHSSQLLDMSNSNGSANGRESSSGPERVAKSISQRVKNAFSALSRFSPRRRSRSIQAQAHSSSEDEPSASDLEVESYLSTGTGSSSTDASSDDDAASPDPAEPILLNYNSEEAIPTAQPPAAPATFPSYSLEAVLNYRVVHSTSTSTSTPISQSPPTSNPLPILDPTNPRSYGAFKKDRVPRTP
ncbi:hypothetical protein FA13DRAFT_68713 [Coprinellus micaceus]|uniref:Uncharacterized protein n=1 Tax=Coprinellus micaceus TaxID=71717 RepID=A0A4Y7TJH9_COPMI|nr:hypothetical protein FA13DRAFT_68713 [Coprinellus micaceus]